MHRHRFRLASLVLVLALGFSPEKLGAGAADELAKVRTQLIALYTRGAPEVRTVERYLGTLRPDGSWPDIDYANKEPGSWRTHRHLSRLLALAEAYRGPGHPLAGNTELREAILRALGNWTGNDYVNPNWWYPQIGVPQTLAPVLILMEGTVPPELKEQTVQRVLGRSKMGMTGQNKVWLAGIALMKGLLANDPQVVTKARNQIFSELRITTQEGVQPDYSFHQHGPQLQWGNYGSAFGSDMIRWAGILHGTEYALEPGQLAVLRAYLQQGPAWVVWNGGMDISGCGRQIFRGCQASKGGAVLRQLEAMKTIDPGEIDAYTALLACLREGGGNTLVGNRHFWRSDITVHRRPTWYASVKMSSTRTIGAETCNGENLLGLHLGDGVTYFQRTGTEYDDPFPVWDWRRLPGTTCRQTEGSLVPNSRACRGRSDFVGGLSDGRRGLAAMEYVRDSLRARKAWFFLDHAVVCLGAGIDGGASDPVLTSVNQCVLNGRVTVSAAQQTRELEKGRHTLEAVRWAHHDGMGYVFCAPTTVTVCAQAQSGNWRRVHSRESARSVERDVFSLWIDHGGTPHGAGYAYFVFPDVDASALPSLCNTLPVTILQQTASILAVAGPDGKFIQATFFEPGRLAWGNASSLEVNVPCLAMWDATADVIHLYVADPTHTQKSVKLWLSGRYVGPQARYDAGRRQTELTITLPPEGFAGQTVGLELRAERP